jgi:hypothetical protein
MLDIHGDTPCCEIAAFMRDAVQYITVGNGVGLLSERAAV